MTPAAECLVELREVTVSYGDGSSRVHAVRDVDLAIAT